jgi:hypothetical protein
MAEIVNGSATALDELRHRAAGVKGRGACFHPEMLSRDAVPNQFRRMARRIVEMCPALALRVAVG